MIMCGGFVAISLLDLRFDGPKVGHTDFLISGQDRLSGKLGSVIKPNGTK